MHKTPKRIYEEIKQERPFLCERKELLHDHDCIGRMTFEHAWTYAGRQIDEKWAIVILCEWAHLRAGLQKEINQWISLRHANPADLKKYPNVDWEQKRKYLNQKYEKQRYH